MSVVKFEEVRFAWLHAFVCVGKLGSYSKAAAFLGVDQSTVSRQIASLEEWLGFEILTKNRPTRLTEDGKYICDISEKTLWQFCDLDRLLRRSIQNMTFNEQEKEKLRVGKILTKFD